MERGEAERVFALVREIGGDLRGRIVSERWWLVWIVMGLEVLVTCCITQLLLWMSEGRLLPFAILWGLHVALLPVIIRIIQRRGGGQRTATEGYLWWIWTTFFLGCLGVVLVEGLVGLPLFKSAPLLALLAAFAFSMLAMVTDRRFLICSGWFVGVTVAMSLWPHGQFLLFGLAWCALLGFLGTWFRLSRTSVASRRL